MELEAINEKLSEMNIGQLRNQDKQLIEKKLRLEKGDEFVEQLIAGRAYDGNCPTDPFEAVMCEGCQ